MSISRFANPVKILVTNPAFRGAFFSTPLYIGSTIVYKRNRHESRNPCEW